ncbi:hypothetical protein ACHAO9_006374 [Fusarium lateritium]
MGEIIRTARGLKDQHFSTLRSMIDALGNLRNVNDPGKSYLDLLPRSCIAVSLGVLKHSKRQEGEWQE